MGASILPVTIHNGKVLLLFGKERNIDSNPGWSDFGGGTDKGETFIETAVREGSEELTGFIGSPSDIKRLLNKHGTIHVDYQSKGYNTYRCHVFPMAYDAGLPYYFNNNQSFLQKRLDPSIIRDSKLFEKTQIKWFDINELAAKRSEFRDFYRNIIDLILEKKTEIIALVKRSLSDKTSFSDKTSLTNKRKTTRRAKKIKQRRSRSRSKKTNK